MTSEGELRSAGLAEATTLVMLVCIAVPLKRLADLPTLTSVMGPVHGIVFMVYIWIVIRSWAEGIITGWGAARLCVGAMIPFGGFVNDRWLRQRFAQGDRA